MTLRHIISTIRRHARREDGAVTVESTLWVGFFVILTCVVADFGFMFHAQARALEVADDGLRDFSVGNLADTSATETAIKARLVNIAPNASVTVTDGLPNNMLSAKVVLPTEDINGFGVLMMLRNTAFIVETTAFREYTE